MSDNVRYFSRKRYLRDSGWSKKADALRAAAFYRRQGHASRVVTGTRYFEVFVHYKYGSNKGL